jgi:hypothetical protein
MTMAITPKTKEKIEHLQKRVRTLGAQAAKGWKMTAVEAVAGAASYYALGALQEKVEFLQSHWYVTPAVLVGAGHFLKRKSAQLGAGLVFLGGFLGAQGYDQDSADGSTDGTIGTKPAEGFDRAGDAGAWGMLDGGEAGALQTGLPSGLDARPQFASPVAMPPQNAGDYVAQEAYGLSD